MDLSHLEWPFYEDHHRAGSAAFAAWAKDHLSGFEADEGNDGVAARELFLLLAQSRWLEKTVPHRDATAATGIDLRHVCLLRELCAYSSAIADVAFSEPWLGILPIALFGSAELKKNFISRYISGRMLPAFALSEPHAGSDAAAIMTTARHDGHHYIINGTKSWTSNAGLADLYIVFARHEDDREKISAFAVDGGASGIRLDERRSVLSPHTVGVWSLDNVRVAADCIVGQRGEGFRIAMTVLELFRPTVGAATLGFARRAMDEAVSHSITRNAFKKPIADHQLIQAKLAQMAVKIDAAALLVYRAAWQHDVTKRDIGRAAAIAKYFSSEAGFDIIDEAVQIFGGLGVVKGSTVERLFRHARAFRIFDGTSEIQQLIIARKIIADAQASNR